MKKVACLWGHLMTVSLLLMSLSVFNIYAAETQKKHTTVMVYMCGADLESASYQATQSMGDMIASKFNLDQVNVVILAGGARFWSGKYDTSMLTVLNINGRRPSVEEELPGASMGEADTLSSFLKYGHEKYPAEHYVLVLWDHGGGPNSGVCFDQLYENDCLSMNELKNALSDSPFQENPLDLLVFNACLMGSAEVANAISPYARYMVAGEDYIYGLSYDWLAGLENDPDPFSTAKRIVDCSYEYNGKIISIQNASEKNSFAAIDLGRMGEIVSLMDNFFPKISINLNKVNFTTMSGERRGTVSFGLGESGSDWDYDLVDLGDLVSHYRSMAEEDADALLSALSDTIYCQTDPDNGCTGMTVYHPFNNKKAIEERISIYNSLDFSNGYKEYIKQFVSLLLDIPMAVYNNLETGIPMANKSTFSVFMVELNEEQAEHLGDAKLCVLLKDEDDSYQLVYTDPQISYENGLIRGEYNGTMLCVVDSTGMPISAPLEYTVDANGNYLISAFLEGASEDGETYTQKAEICCVFDKDTGKLEPKGIQIWEEFLGGYTTAYASSLQDYLSICIPITARVRPEPNEKGELPSYKEWELRDTGEEWESDIDGSWEFAVLNNTLPRENLFVTFQLTDSQNYAYSSSLLQLGERMIPVFLEYNNDELETLLLDTDRFNAKVVEDTLRISGTVVYSGEREITLCAEGLKVNETEISDGSVPEVYGKGPNWGLVMSYDETGKEIPDQQVMNIAIDAESLSQDIEFQTISFTIKAIDAVNGETVANIPVDLSIKTEYLFPSDK